MAWTFELCDIATDTTLADVTSQVLKAKLQPRLNRPLMASLTLKPANHALLTALQGDGDPALWVGTRAIKAKRNGTLRGHLIAWTLTFSGSTEKDPAVELLCASPLARLQQRYVFDSAGRVADPQFGGPTTPITAGDLLQQVIANTVTHEDDLGSPLPLPIITTGGTFTATQNVWWSVTDAPLTIGELVTTLTDAGACDVVVDPIDTSSGANPGEMGRLSVYDVAGVDRSATVSFDYDAGLKNVSDARRVIDLSTVGNRITYELGQRKDKNHWQGNITGTETGAAEGSEDLTAFQALQLASRGKYGTFSEFRVYDSDDDNRFGRPLYHKLWKTEVTLRVNPRDQVFFTPAGHGVNNVQYDPFDDYDVGDIVSINSSTALGPAIASTQQRIYGFDVDIDENGVEKVSELICSADAE